MPGYKMKPKFKQMAFETAVRNPERYKKILSEVAEFEGCVLNDENLLKIVCKLAKAGIVTARNLDLTSLSGKQLETAVINTNASRRADGGFPKGYPARFWTYMRTQCELGLVYATYNEEFKISPIAHKMIEEELDEQTVFANQSVIYNRRSPFRNVSNDFNYFRFIIEVLMERWSHNKGLTMEQFILSMYSKDGNVNAFINELSNFHVSDLNETYEYLKTNYGETNEFTTVCKDYPDVVIRLLRITGFVTLKYVGKLIIQINEDQIDYINKMFSYSYSFTVQEKEDRKLFYDKFLSFSSDLLEKTKSVVISTTSIDYSSKLQGIIDTYNIDLEKACELIDNIGTGSTMEAFKYVPEPIKLEFYITLLLFLKFGSSFNVKPNYKPDSFGLPIAQAPGGKGDIEVYSDSLYWLVEVTLIRNKNQQLNNETANLIRHLEEGTRQGYLSLVAPVIHPDTITFFNNEIIGFLMKSKKVYLKPFSISEFKDKTISGIVMEDIKTYTINYIEAAKKAILNS